MTVNARIRELLAQVIGEERLEADDETPVGRLPNWDSLAHVNALFALEEEFGVVLDPEDFEPATSIGDLERLLERARG